MKKLIVPIVIGLAAGLGGGSGFAYLRMSSRYVVDSTRLAQETAARDSVARDSVARDSVARDSVARAATGAHADSTGAAHGHGADSAAAPLTPADSIRALHAARTTHRAEASGSKPVAHTAPPDAAPAPDKGKAAAPKGTPPTVGTTPAPTDPLDRMVAAAPEVAAAMRDVRNAALKEAIPEQRLASIFAAMRAKEAAKVLDQMSDRDVRVILNLMSDRKAAELLTLLPPARAAIVTRGAPAPAKETP
jgi:hypothetical protein